MLVGTVDIFIFFASSIAHVNNLTSMLFRLGKLLMFYADL